MKHFFVYFYFLIGFIYCKSPKKENNSPTLIAEKKEIKDSKIFQCITERDTVFGNGNYIKYIALDSMFGVEIKINGLIDTLDFLFDCETPNSLIPSILKQEDNMLILKQGIAFTYRNTVVCKKKGNKLECKSFEISKVVVDAPQVLIYKTEDNCVLEIFNIISKKEKYITLPLKYCHSEIKLIEEYLTHFIIKFTDGEKFQYKFLN